MLKPVFAVVTVLSTIWDFKVFTQIYLMPGGSGANRDVLNLGTWSYINAFAQGTATASGRRSPCCSRAAAGHHAGLSPRLCSGRRSCDQQRGQAGCAGQALAQGAVLTASASRCWCSALFPVLVMLSTAFDAQASDGPAPCCRRTCRWSNFRSCSTRAGSRRYLRNSLLVGLGTVVISAAAGAAGRGGGGAVPLPVPDGGPGAVLVVQMVPLEALVIPLFIQLNLHMLDSLLGLIVVYVAFSLPFAIWMLRGFVAAVPKEIEEAAYLDGASWPRMFRSVLLPAGRARAGGDQRVLVHHGLERVHLRDHLPQRRQQVHRRRRAAAVLRPARHRLGCVMAGSTLITRAGDDLLRDRAASAQRGLVAGAVKG